MRAKTAYAMLSVLCAFLLLLASRASAQVNTAAPRITQAISDSRLISLRGNTHPLARGEFDRGAAPADLPLERMTLLLQRSPEQEAALDKFMAEQLDPASPNFHHWLSPEQFGALYGPSDQDIETIKAWLASHGFAVNSVSKGRTTIEFSGNAAQVQEAYHTAIHKFVLPNGEEHWANVNDPAIPAALAPVVSGIHSLHNIFPKPMNHVRGPITRSTPLIGANARPMSFATGSNCSIVQDQPFNLAPAGFECFMVTPGDLAVIYNIASPAGDGTGQTIAIVGGSSIKIQDVRSFRSLMGLSAKDPLIILAGTDPGVDNSKGFETEALLDAEWCGAAAPNAALDLVIAKDTTTTAGVDIAAQFIVDNNLAPVLSESFGDCESDLGTSGNSFYNNLWQQAAAQGITVFVSSGDTGSAGCDTGNAAASLGLAVNGLASTPFNVAVGGTDFYDVANPTTFWNTGTTSPAQTSASIYIPEAAWNESCANPIFYTVLSGFGANAEAVCNNSQVVNYPKQATGNPSLVVAFGSSGGPSNCTTPGATPPASCSGGYPKPAWQTGTGVPSDGKRDLPDVSMLAAVGNISASFYYLCESDLAPCTFTGNAQIFGGGGTSVSTQVLGGVMALVLEHVNGVRQGNANPVFYALAAQPPPANCNSASPPQSNCIFNDVTLGTNAMPCTAGSPNCTVSGGDATGILFSNGAAAYNAGVGYDLATGLGSVNVANLVNATQPGNGSGWSTTSNTPDFTLASSGTASVSGNTGTLMVTVNPVNSFSGQVTLSCAALAAGETCTFSPTSPATINGSTQITVTIHGVGALLPPASWKPAFRAPSGIALVGALLTVFLMISLRGRSPRWSTALAAVALALMIGIAGCAGSSNSGGGGGGGLTVGTGVFTAGGNGVTHSIGFTIP